FRFHLADPWFIGCCAAGTGLLLLGVTLACWRGLAHAVTEALTGWGDNFELLRVTFFGWIVFTICLGLGLFTRVSAVLVWVLTISFSNLNPIVNHGEVAVRTIILFYL